MNKLKNIVCSDLFKGFAFSFGLILLLGIGGRFDWADQMLYNMGPTIYNEIANKLGPDCSDYDIAKEYSDNYECYEARRKEMQAKRN